MLAPTLAVSGSNSLPKPTGSSQSQNGGAAAVGTSAYTAQSHAPAAHDEYANLPPLQRKIVYFIMNEPQADEGVHVAAIAREIKGMAEASDLR